MEKLLKVFVSGLFAFCFFVLFSNLAVIDRQYNNNGQVSSIYITKRKMIIRKGVI